MFHRMIPVSFIAYDTAGQAYTIHCGDPSADRNGPSVALRDRLKTSDGKHVNRLEKGKYEILIDRRGTFKSLFQKDRIVVTTDDPDAP